MESWKWLVSSWPWVLLEWKKAIPGQKPPDDQAGAPHGQSGTQPGPEERVQNVTWSGLVSHDAILPEGANPDHDDQLAISGLHAQSTTPDIDPLQFKSPRFSAILPDNENLHNQTCALPGNATDDTGLSGLVDPPSTVQGVMPDSRSNLTESITSESLNPSPNLLQTSPPVEFWAESRNPAQCSQLSGAPYRALAGCSPGPPGLDG
ncbi:hypothetical protein HOY82DRAFT_605509 [Tuber indicum]|nr:hypothetical protein HOY82DRAFT_605509 [Tuber indicum]